MWVECTECCCWISFWDSEWFSWRRDLSLGISAGTNILSMYNSRLLPAWVHSWMFSNENSPCTPSTTSTGHLSTRLKLAPPKLKLCHAPLRYVWVDIRCSFFVSIQVVSVLVWKYYRNRSFYVWSGSLIAGQHYICYPEKGL